MMDNFGTIELEGMEFHSFHGVLEREKAAGNHFTVDFKGDLDMSTAIETDNLEDALDYSLIYNTIAREMDIHSDLLEHLAGRIVNAISSEFIQFRSFSVRVSKQRPPVDGIVRWSRVTLHYNRSV